MKGIIQSWLKMDIGKRTNCQTFGSLCFCGIWLKDTWEYSGKVEKPSADNQKNQIDFQTPFTYKNKSFPLQNWFHNLIHLKMQPTRSLTHVCVQHKNSLVGLVCAKPSTFLSAESHPSYSTYLISSKKSLRLWYNWDFFSFL